MLRNGIGLATLMAGIGLSSPGLAAHVSRSGTTLVVQRATASADFDQVPRTAKHIAASYGIVTSTFRTVLHNREVGGVPNSYHLTGRAMDVARRSGVTHAEIAAALRASGYMPIESLDEGDHSHFAFSNTPSVAAAAAEQPAPAAIGPHIAADEHGSLIADLRSTSGRR